MTKIEELQQRLAQLSQERSQLSISYNQFTGAMMEVERQIAEEQKKLEEDGEMGEEFDRLMDNQKAALIRSTKLKQQLKKRKEMPSDEAKAKKKLAQRIMATNHRRNKAKGGMGLKMHTADQVGLKKLPTAVRNKMGYMYGGGMAKKPKMGSMDYRKGGLLLIAVDMMKKKKKGK